MPDQSFAPLIAGFGGGVVSTTLLLPLDVVKVRLQVSESSKSNVHKGPRLGTLRVFRGIIKYEGIRGLYQGWTPAVLGSAVSWGGYFYLYENLKRQLVAWKLGSSTVTAKDLQNTADTLNSVENFGLACFSGACMVLFTNPLWLLKLRMQLQMKRASELYATIKPYKNMLDATQTIIREEGFMALYKGAGAALLLTSHGGVQFMVYEALKKRFNFKRISSDENPNHSVGERLQLSVGYLSIGALSKIVASTTTYPLQVIKSRLQQRSVSLELTAEGNVRPVKREYHGLRKTVRRIWKREGIAGFFRGCIPNAIRVAPGAAITFVTYEAIMDMLH